MDPVTRCVRIAAFPCRLHPRRRSSIYP
jgi:hypothetical protein